MTEAVVSRSVTESLLLLEKHPLCQSRAKICDRWSQSCVTSSKRFDIYIPANSCNDAYIYHNASRQNRQYTGFKNDVGNGQNIDDQHRHLPLQSRGMLFLMWWIEWALPLWTLQYEFNLSNFYCQTAVKVKFGRRDAGGEWEQRRCPPGQTEEEVPQPVDPQDQQHRTGSLRPAERHAGGAGKDSPLQCVGWLPHPYVSLWGTNETLRTCWQKVPGCTHVYVPVSGTGAHAHHDLWRPDNTL